MLNSHKYVFNAKIMFNSNGQMVSSAAESFWKLIHKNHMTHSDVASILYLDHKSGPTARVHERYYADSNPPPPALVDVDDDDDDLFTIDAAPSAPPGAPLPPRTAAASSSAAASSAAA